MRHAINNPLVSVRTVKSLNLPPMHISLQKLCGPVSAQWRGFYKDNIIIGPSPMSSFQLSEVAIIHIDMTMLMDLTPQLFSLTISYLKWISLFVF